MVFSSFSRTGGSIGLAVLLVMSSFVMVAVGTPHAVSASTGCTSGSVSTTTEIGRNYLGESDEVVGAPRVSSDRKLHRYTKVTFTSNGVSDASCTWVAPAGVTTGQVLAVGGGGAGGTYFGGGGGGGAMYFNKLPVITPGQSYAITVGMGGASVPISCIPHCNGGNGHASQIENIGWAGGGSGGGGNTNE
ncbi:MAG: glycine-rich domain-containing protein, partial [Ilumatobacteraceae bacterium]